MHLISTRMIGRPYRNVQPMYLPKTIVTAGVARFFLVHDTKTGKNITNEHKI
jgi:hypothetical protein